MKLTPANVKQTIKEALEKDGMDLSDFEQALSRMPKEKTAADVLGAGIDAAKLLTLSAALAGIGGGYGLYKGYKGVEDSDEKVKKQLMAQRQYEEAIKELQAAKQHPGM